MNLLIKLFAKLLVCFVNISNAQTPQIQISPNPCVNRTLLTYSVLTADTVSLRVFDITGALKVTLLSNIFLGQGIYQDSLILNNLPNGIYVASLTGKLNSKPQAIGKIIKTGVTGIVKVYNEPEIKIYPNPSSTIIYMKQVLVRVLFYF